MASNPIKGPSPSDPIKGNSNEIKTASSSHRKLEKVEKVGEVDPDQRSKSKFKSIMDNESSTEETNSSLPSPLDLFATQDNSKSNQKISLSDNDPAQIIPSPTYSPPPPASSLPLTGEMKAPPLPRSDDFWTEIDEPIDELPKNPKVIKTSDLSPRILSHPESNKEKSPLSSHLGIPIKEPSSLTPPSIAKEKKKDSEKKTEEIPSPPFQKTKEARSSQKEKEIPLSTAPPFLPEEEKKPAPFFSVEKEKKRSREPLFETREKSYEKDKPNPLFREEEKGSPIPHATEKFESKVDKTKKKETGPEEIKAASAHPLPAEIIPVATAATAAAMPYLKPETFSLFYQMVGTIYVMENRSGVTRTEIILNATSYTQSKFYGASIIIEKYATAPDSFNIRLTGSNEAVTAFNQNIPNLLSAFQKGNFSFGIGRIEAEYKSEKPIFRRKEAREENDFGGNFTDKDR